MIIAKTLRELGYDVGEAGNGREALDALKREDAISLILTDWNMPEMNGLEFVKRLRQERVWDATPVVMVTTETEIEQMSAALTAGANEYIMKPFNKSVLLEKLQLLGVAC